MPFRHRRLMSWTFRTWSVLARSLVVAGKRFGLGYAGVTRPRVWSPCASLKPEARPVKARPRVYNLIKTTWLAACMVSLAALGFVFLNMQAVWASAAVAALKKGAFAS